HSPYCSLSSAAQVGQNRKACGKGTILAIRPERICTPIPCAPDISQRNWVTRAGGKNGAKSGSKVCSSIKVSAVCTAFGGKLVTRYSSRQGSATVAMACGSPKYVTPTDRRFG